MPVRRKPKSVEEFIENGGSAPQAESQAIASEPSPNVEKVAKKEEIQPLKLRLPSSLLTQVDESVAKRRPAPSRHQWILEAIYEKLDRELGEE